MHYALLRILIYCKRFNYGYATVVSSYSHQLLLVSVHGLYKLGEDILDELCIKFSNLRVVLLYIQI